MIRIGSWFKRRESTAWSQKEIKTFKALKIDPDSQDLKDMEAYYTATFPKDKDYRRRDITTMLNNWAGECDRARKYVAESTIKKQVSL